MTLVDSGGSAAHSMGYCHESTGDYFWTSGDAETEMTARVSVAGGVRFSFKLYADTFTGTVDVTNGSAAIVGGGAAFTTQLAVGMKIQFASQVGTIYTILSITNDNSATLTAVYTGTTTLATTMTRSVGVKGFYGNNVAPFPNSAATLANPSSGTLSGAGAGNSVNGLIADNGATTYEVSWMASSDGFSGGQRAKFQIEQI